MNGIGFENMKVFKEQQWFDFKNITLLTGTNNSGKSSIINAMQMLQENIKASNIDDLIKTEFKISSNLNKYGSIANFVNNQANSEDNYLVFLRQIKSVEYKIKVGINPGLESYGSITEIIAFDLKSKEDVFNLSVSNPYPDYQCNFNINYKYFIDRFNKKCENTEKIRKRKVEFVELSNEVDKGNKPFKELEDFLANLSKECSVYLKHISPKIKFFWVSDYFDPYEKGEEIEEIGAFFTKSIEGNQYSSFISEDDYNKLYAQSFRKGIFDFSILWDKNPEIQTEFENIICSYYKKEYTASHKLLCDDLITFLSHSNWDMIFDENYHMNEPQLISEHLTKKFINSLPDFGLIGTMIRLSNEDELYSGKSYVADDYVIAKQSLNEEKKPFDTLVNSGFIDEVFLKLRELFAIHYDENEGLIDHRRLITKPAFNEIYRDIEQKILNLNLGISNVYVSSNRFTTKRSYHFNDNTDFTTLIKQVEEPTVWKINHCKEFISKWINEFDIADELLLKPDVETGNFKASLRKGNKETQLADFGLGTNQLLPIIFSLAIHRYRPKSEVYGDVLIPRTVVIEEPEANLHPALQSKLADLFVDANAKFGVQIIAETHSEYLIRRMQYLVAKNELHHKNENSISIANDKVNIHYINAELDEEGRKAYEISFTKNGQLSESFGKGFLDETTTLQFELYKLNNAQSN